MYTDTYKKLVALVAALEPDVLKANNNNQAAKVRVRQSSRAIMKDFQAFINATKEPATPDTQQD